MGSGKQLASAGKRITRAMLRWRRAAGNARLHVTGDFDDEDIVRSIARVLVFLGMARASANA